VLKVNALIHMF